MLVKSPVSGAFFLFKIKIGFFAKKALTENVCSIECALSSRDMSSFKPLERVTKIF